MVTVKELQASKPGKWISDKGPRGAGVLLFRRMAGGAILAYYRYTLPDGTRDTLALGQYEEQGKDGMTLAEARAKAGDLSRQYQAGARNIREHLGAEQAAREAAKLAAREAADAAKEAAQARRAYTLRALCGAYTATLDRGGKTKSAKDARSTFRCHVFDPDPHIADTPAREVTPHQVAALVRRVREAGKERTAGILRSYLSAAYSAAKRAPFDSSLPADLIPFNIDSNPVDAIPTVPVRAGNRTLSAAELRAYMAALGGGLPDQALKLALLAGGQRMAQLLRARATDYDADTKTLRLWDGKGRRAVAREHLLPLGPAAAALAEELVRRTEARQAGGQASKESPWLFVSVGGVPMTDTTPGKRAAEIAAAMGGEPFDLRDIRRTVETMLAGLGINRDTRAQLLSHGLAGVQQAHYDRHTYAAEKRAALVAWERHLGAIEAGEAAAGNVRPLGRQVSAS